MSNPKDEGPLFDPLNLDDAFPTDEPSPEGIAIPADEAASTPDPFANDPFAAAGIPSDVASEEPVMPLAPAPKGDKKKRKTKAPKAAKAARERAPKAAAGGFGGALARTNVFTWMLCLSFLALVLACLFLLIELKRYNYDIGAEEGKRVACAPSVSPDHSRFA